MRSCLKSNDELVLELHNAHEEHKASINEMIRQASQIADAMKEVQENRSRILLKKLELDEVGESKLTREVETLNTEPATRKLQERYEEVRNVERAMAEKGSQPEAELFSTLQNDEPQEERKEVIKHLGKSEAPLFCLQTTMLHPSGKGLKEFISGTTRENLKQGVNLLETPDKQEETYSPVTDEQEECDNKGRSNRGSEGNGKRAAGKDECIKRERRP